MIRIVKCAQDCGSGAALSYRREPDDGLYSDMLITVWNGDGEYEAGIYVNRETASEIRMYLDEFERIMEGRKE
jgi:hypothetical protein